MLCSLRERVFSSIMQSKQPWYLLWLLVLAASVSACRSPELVEQEVRLGPSTTMVIELPSDWETSQYERNSSYTVWGSGGILGRDKTTVRFQAATTLRSPAPSEEHLAAEIHYLIEYIVTEGGSASIIQEPTSHESGSYDVATAVLEYYDPRNLLERVVSPGSLGNARTMEMQTITCADRSPGIVSIRHIPGNSDELNAQAREIIDSVQLACE